MTMNHALELSQLTNRVHPALCPSDNTGYVPQLFENVMMYTLMMGSSLAFNPIKFNCNARGMSAGSTMLLGLAATEVYSNVSPSPKLSSMFSWFKTLKSCPSSRMPMLWTAMGIRSDTCGSPKGPTLHDVARTASPNVMFTGGQKRLKSRVNSYVLGAHEHTSVSWPELPGVPTRSSPTNDAAAIFMFIIVCVK